MTVPETNPGPRVGIVVLNYRNWSDTLACLQSLSAATYPRTFIVVVDNGCSDDSAAVARAFGARVVPEPVRGIPAAAATGYDAATGDVIARCDADSRLPADWIEHVVRVLDTCRQADIWNIAFATLAPGS